MVDKKVLWMVAMLAFLKVGSKVALMDVLMVVMMVWMMAD